MIYSIGIGTNILDLKAKESMKNILHYGLQRSGTNVLEAHLNQNFNVSLLNSLDRTNPLHKHFRLYEEKQFIPEPQFQNKLSFKSFAEFEHSFDINTKIEGIIIISKDPYSWYTSYTNWAKKCQWPEVNYHYIEEYNLFHAKWLEFSKQSNKISLIRYIDLITDAKNVLTQLKNQHQLPLKLKSKIFGIQSEIKKVSESDTFTKEKLKFYTEKEYLLKISSEKIDEINSKLDKNLMKDLGYQIENPAGN